jgi:hypothetical protein
MLPALIVTLPAFAISRPTPAVVVIVVDANVRVPPPVPVCSEMPSVPAVTVVAPKVRLALLPETRMPCVVVPEIVVGPKPNVPVMFCSDRPCVELDVDVVLTRLPASAPPLRFIARPVPASTTLLTVSVPTPVPVMSAPAAPLSPIVKPRRWLPVPSVTQAPAQLMTGCVPVSVWNAEPTTGVMPVWPCRVSSIAASPIRRTPFSSVAVAVWLPGNITIESLAVCAAAATASVAGQAWVPVLSPVQVVPVASSSTNQTSSS